MNDQITSASPSKVAKPRKPRKPVDPYLNDAPFVAWVQAMQVRLNNYRVLFGNQLFTTDVDLWPHYLKSLPAHTRQYHTCNCCKQFIQRFGNVVFLNNEGLPVSIWHPDDAPKHYKDTAIALGLKADGAAITGVFVPDQFTYGQHTTGDWSHFAINLPTTMVWTNKVKTAYQREAELREDFGMVVRALQDFDLATITKVHAAAAAGRLYRGEKVEATAEWFKLLHTAIKGKRGKVRNNVIWDAVATAPVGFAHIRSGVLGSLLEDLAGGMDFDSAAKAFEKKMHPLQYLRPSAPPKAGNITQAEKLFEELGLARSLERRFATLADIETVWEPKRPKQSPSEGLFGHLQSRHYPKLDVVKGVTPITWSRFNRDVLPNAESIEIYVPTSGSFSSFVTSIHPDAPPILQWDLEEYRNPVSWYFWSGGSSAVSFGLRAGTWAPVLAVSLQPSMWGPHGNKFDRHGKGAMFVIQGARDTRAPSLALFPETIRSELHTVRSTIEAHSKSRRLPHASSQQEAAGIMSRFDKQDKSVQVQVTAGGLRTTYEIDRWE